MDNEDINILSLPYEVLYEIFRLLDFKGKCNVARVCQTFQNVIFNEFWVKELKDFDATQRPIADLNESEFEFILSVMHKSIRSFKVNYNVDFMSYLCQWELSLPFCTVYDMPELEYFEYHSDSLIDVYSDTGTRENYPGQFISRLQNLKILIMPTTTINSANLNPILSNLVELSIFNIEDVDNVIIDTNNTLERIHITFNLINNGFVKHLHVMRKLKLVTIAAKEYNFHLRNFNINDFTAFTDFVREKCQYVEMFVTRRGSTYSKALECLYAGIPYFRNIYKMQLAMPSSRMHYKYFAKIYLAAEDSFELHIRDGDIVSIEKVLQACPRNSSIYLYNDADILRRIESTIQHLKRNMNPGMNLTFNIVIKANEPERQNLRMIFDLILQSSTYINQGFITLHLMFEGPIDLTYKSEFLDTKIGFFLKPDETTIATTTTSEEN